MGISIGSRESDEKMGVSTEERRDRGRREKRRGRRSGRRRENNGATIVIVREKGGNRERGNAIDRTEMRIEKSGFGAGGFRKGGRGRGGRRKMDVLLCIVAFHERRIEIGIEINVVESVLIRVVIVRSVWRRERRGIVCVCVIMKELTVDIEIEIESESESESRYGMKMS